MRQNALLGDIFEIYSINTSTSDASRNFNKNEKRRYFHMRNGRRNYGEAVVLRKFTFIVEFN